MRSFAKILLAAAAAASTLLIASGAEASTLVGAITADNEYNAYLSTSDAALGSLVATGAWWPTAQTFSAPLNAGQTYYLHVIANNWYGPGNMGGGNPDALLGSFSLSDASHSFSNGLQTLGTDAMNWRADANSFVQNLGAITTWNAPGGSPVGFAANGGAIWGAVLGGPVGGISNSAQWIWSGSDPSGEAFFSTTISAAGGVPEPAAWSLLLTGFFGIGALLRRRAIVMG